MSVSRNDNTQVNYELTTRQRATIVAGTALSLERIMALDDGDINFSFFQQNSIKAANLVVASISPASLKHRGVATPHNLRELDYDAIHLLDSTFCSSCIAAYGATELTKSFLVNSSDAVTLAGSAAMHQLGVDVGTLLAICAGSPVQAHAVLEQSAPRGGALNGVAPLTLLDTGLRAQKLRDLGYTPRLIQEQTRATSAQLSKLGF